MTRRLSPEIQAEEARVEVLALAHELTEGDRLKAVALHDLGVAIRRGDLPLAARIHAWLEHYDGTQNRKHEEIRHAYAWPEASAPASRTERARRGGLAVLERYGPEHFAQITKGGKRRPRHHAPQEMAGQPAGKTPIRIEGRRAHHSNDAA